MVGTSPIFCGGSEASWISLLAAWDCAGAVEILTHWPRAMLWISGEWRPLSRIVN